MYTQDTIAAVATPPGIGGVGIIRISGMQALSLARHLFQHTAPAKDLQPGRMYFGDFLDIKGTTIDSGYFVWFRKPISFTGEDVVEFHCHGGMIILQSIMRALFEHGVRPAEPGEFSRRAFLNGRIDLIQAEAIADMISAGSTRAAEIARTHFRGKLSQTIESVRQEIAAILAGLEAEIDYPETGNYAGEEDSVLVLRQQIATLESLLNTYDEGKVYKEGIVTVILGRPNVGKSSLLNSLAGEERAIVTDIPGTTRDIVEVPVVIRGIPLRLADTAGIHESLDTVEQIGIEKARKLAAQADLSLLVLDSSDSLRDEDLGLLKSVQAQRTLIVLNKIDLPSRFDVGILANQGFTNVHKVSVLQGLGLEELKDRIEKMFTSGSFQPDTTFITNQRHHQALAEAVSVLNVAAEGWGVLPLDLIALDLREGWQRLGEITGSVWTEDLLDCIFQRFCLGK